MLEVPGASLKSSFTAAVILGNATLWQSARAMIACVLMKSGLTLKLLSAVSPVFVTARAAARSALVASSWFSPMMCTGAVASLSRWRSSSSTESTRRSRECAGRSMPAAVPSTMMAANVCVSSNGFMSGTCVVSPCTWRILTPARPVTFHSGAAPFAGRAKPHFSMSSANSSVSMRLRKTMVDDAYAESGCARSSTRAARFFVSTFHLARHPQTRTFFDPVCFTAAAASCPRHTSSPRARTRSSAATRAAPASSRRPR